MKTLGEITKMDIEIWKENLRRNQEAHPDWSPLRLVESTPQAGAFSVATGSISVSSANALIAEWRKHASGCMKVARTHDKAGIAAANESRSAALRKSRREEKAKREQAENHEHSRYRWYRVAETFRFCAKELRRQVALTNKRQPKSNAKDEPRGSAHKVIQ